MKSNICESCEHLMETEPGIIVCAAGRGAVEQKTICADSAETGNQVQGGGMNKRPLTIIESPFGTHVDGTRCTLEEMAANVAYGLRCIRDSLDRGEAPFGSHLLYPLVYDDATPSERKAGMEAGFAWGEVARQVAVYEDFGITEGMREGIRRHRSGGLKVEYRQIGTK